MPRDNQLNKGEDRRVMYVENKDGNLDGVTARIGWVSFTKSGKGIYYRGRQLLRSTQLIGGNYFDSKTGETFWVSGIKKRGSNTHPAERNISFEVDADALEAYNSIKNG